MILTSAVVHRSLYLPRHAALSRVLTNTINRNNYDRTMMSKMRGYHRWDTNRFFYSNRYSSSNNNRHQQSRLLQQMPLHDEKLGKRTFSTITHSKPNKFTLPHLSRHFASATTSKNNCKGEKHDTEDKSTKVTPFNSIMAPAMDEPMDQRILFQYLQLETFSESEIDQVFDTIATSGTISSTSPYHCNPNDMPPLSQAPHNQQRQQQQKMTSHMAPTQVITRHEIAAFLLHRIKQIDANNPQYTDLYENNTNTKEHVREIQQHRHLAMQQYANAQSTHVISLLQSTTSSTVDNTNPKNQQSQSQLSPSFNLKKPSFRNQIQTLATNNLSLTSNGKTNIIYPLSLSMLLVGSSVGIVIPIMPFIVSELSLTATQYGIVVSSFAAAKLFANVPSAVYAERYGRKPSLVRGLLILSVGVGGIGLASQFEHLVICRLLAGMGVSSLSTASTLAVADESTALNRAQSMAPVMSAFAAGMAMGPAVGGILGDAVGVPLTFGFVGCSYLMLAGLNEMFLEETKLVGLEKRVFPWQQGEGKGQQRKLHGAFVASNDKKTNTTVLDAMKDAVSQWSPLLAKNPQVRNVITMNGFYWVALSGAQMTLLPLILTDPTGLALSATSVGKVYMGVSLVQVMGNPTMAKFVDVVGRFPGIVIGCSMLSTSMFLLPYVTTIGDGSGALGNHHMTLAAVLGCWALGSTMLSTAPISYVTDAVSENQRAQAIALLRTAGDIGFLVGASGTGVVADWYGMDMALQSDAGLLLLATGWFAARRILYHKQKNITK